MQGCSSQRRTPHSGEPGAIPGNLHYEDVPNGTILASSRIGGLHGDCHNSGSNPDACLRGCTITVCPFFITTRGSD